MEFKGTKRAEEYANGKSSSSVFKENHIKDYLNGYNQALEDSKYTEMLEMLSNLYNDLKQGAMPTHEEIKSVKQLIKEATELK